ncbi:hypothetical protein F183_A08790 [Bryobacterales bacterium F-183]|nr:hypothetical protein F183_A08790 [Bryobacterales bacterium F-183]
MLKGIRPGATAGYAGTIACLLFLGSAANLKADTILGNLPVTNDSTPTVIGGQFVKAIGFTLSPGQNYNLTQLTLRLAGFSVGRVPVVTLRENVGGADPGANVLVQFSNPPAQGNDYFNYAFTPASPFTLLANTKYWLVVSESAGTIAWSASIPSVTPSGVAVLNNNRLSTDGGLSYGDSARFNNFQLEGTPVVNPVPEASSALFLLGAVAVAARLRKDR